MPRKPRKLRVMKPPALSSAWRAFFETGASGKGTPDHVDIFMVEANYELMLAAWEPHREEFLTDWKRQGEKGLPWIVKKLKECKRIEGIT
jgi:hypothetical protein